jgi:hypothetical protein
MARCADRAAPAGSPKKWISPSLARPTARSFDRSARSRASGQAITKAITNTKSASERTLRNDRRASTAPLAIGPGNGCIPGAAAEARRQIPRLRCVAHRQSQCRFRAAGRMSGIGGRTGDPSGSRSCSDSMRLVPVAAHDLGIATKNLQIPGRFFRCTVRIFASRAWDQHPILAPVRTCAR